MNTNFSSINFSTSRFRWSDSSLEGKKKITPGIREEDELKEGKSYKDIKTESTDWT